MTPKDDPTTDISISMREKLLAAGLRPTRQREGLAQLLFGQGNRHVNAEQLHQEASSEKISVSLATIYNTLHQFTKAGLLREVIVDSGSSYFDTNTAPHHHFYYEDQQQLEDIANDHLAISQIPTIPEGTEIAAIDVIVRLKHSPQA